MPENRAAGSRLSHLLATSIAITRLTVSPDPAHLVDTREQVARL
jgi:hypothetical protein